MRGKFITLEGGEGAGKSTQAQLLARTFESAGRSVVVTREPGGAAGAEEIRALLVTGGIGRWSPMAEALLHYAARRNHLDRTILPALDRGIWVICDRFADSTMAYQGYGHDLGRDVVSELHRVAIGEFTPDLTLILDLPVDVGLRRAGIRAGVGANGEDRYERMRPAFHRRLREGFLDIARLDPGRCVVIDADRSIEAVRQAVVDAVNERLGADS
jgi:dTMP kinase